MIKKNYLKVLALAATVAVPMIVTNTAYAGEYLAGDFHQRIAQRSAQTYQDGCVE